LEQNSINLDLVDMRVDLSLEIYGRRKT